MGSLHKIFLWTICTFMSLANYWEDTLQMKIRFFIIRFISPWLFWYQYLTTFFYVRISVAERFFLSLFHFDRRLYLDSNQINFKMEGSTVYLRHKLPLDPQFKGSSAYSETTCPNIKIVNILDLFTLCCLVRTSVTIQTYAHKAIDRSLRRSFL